MVDKTMSSHAMAVNWDRSVLANAQHVSANEMLRGAWGFTGEWTCVQVRTVQTLGVLRICNSLACSGNQ